MREGIDPRDAQKEDAAPGIESGVLARDDMVSVVASLRAWESDGTWGAAHAR